ncbi:hypothetical protein HA050_00040 [Iodobacter sp. HSC-16F04]|uniref:Uncharacterized protein n=1 Tax=Iodobacter violaceini TaxID=3044271 RepID=A0ABX0KQH2_9NEIS|nr:hypothetical protein [Iodobacter violacea]NHQ84510.1 hypothetical protein [Iodobacter violacea]
MLIVTEKEGVVGWPSMGCKKRERLDVRAMSGKGRVPYLHRDASILNLGFDSLCECFVVFTGCEIWLSNIPECIRKDKKYLFIIISHVFV